MAAPIGNLYALGNNGGRPPIYSNPEELEEKISEYFTWLNGEFHIEEKEVTNKKTKKKEKVKEKIWDRAPENPTITGLALFLGFENKRSLYDYAKKEEFSHPIKRALSVVENQYEKYLLSTSSTGAIFALKNMEWTDKTQTELTGKDGNPIVWQETKTYGSYNKTD